MAARYRTPDVFVPGDNPPAAWDDWLETFRLYMSATESTLKPQSAQIDSFLYHVGPDARKIYKTLTISPSTPPTSSTPNPPIILDDVLCAFTDYYKPYKNLTSARHVFLSTRQLPHQSFDDFVTDLKIKAIPCDFGVIHDSLLCSLIVLGVRDDAVRRELLKIPVLNLTDVIAHCRADDSSKATALAMSARLPSPSAASPTSLYAVNVTHQQTTNSSRSRPFQRRRAPNDRGRLNTRTRGRPSGYTSASYSSSLCDYCAERHPDKQCPAWGAECNKCHRLNHWAKACRQTFTLQEVHPHQNSHSTPDHCAQRDYFPASSLHPASSASMPPTSRSVPLPYTGYTASTTPSSAYDPSHALVDEFSRYHIASLCSSAEHPSPQDWVATLRVNGLPVTFKLDTGSQVNVLNVTTYERIRDRPILCPPPAHVMSYSGHSIPMLGVIQAVCTAPTATQTLPFYITGQDTMPILGAHASVSLNLIQRLYAAHTPESHPTIPDTAVQAILDEFRDCFDSVGCLPGEHSITLKPNARPVVTSPRSVPLALEAPLRDELQRMVNLGIITPVTDPTDWVHPMVIVPKPDGSLRVCLDPRNLNAALKREHYKMPTTREIFSHLQGCTVFTVLDATSAFWQIRLTKESSKLCTFATPYGRYRFLRLPYGIASAPEIFQRTMHEVFKDIPHCFSSMDDLLIATPGVSHHLALLREILERARKAKLRFSTKKLQLAVPEIIYLGHTITRDGIRVDNRKVQAITEMAPPADKHSLQRFLGLFNYVSKFVPHHSAKTAPLRALLKKDSSFMWDANAQAVLDELKASIIQAPVLSFFDPQIVPTISVDASQSGIGAVLLQNDHPVEYASTTLTGTQQRYAQIEKELLAVVYGLEHFHYYIVGNSVTVQTDHKPLLSLIKKPLHLLSPRLQRMVLQLSRYDPTLVYVPGAQLYIADALSRAPLPTCAVKTDLMEGPSAALHSLTTISPQKHADFELATANDAVLTIVRSYTMDGWPKHKTQVPTSVLPYWPIKEEIHIMENLLYRGDRLLVPETQRLHVMKLLHSAHQGINACVRKAKIHVYWPGMQSEIEQFIQQCGICRSRDKANQAAPLQPHPVPKLPWETIGVDLFHSYPSSTLLIVDYHSKFVEINDLKSTTALSIIQAMKPHFARYGIPQRIVTDNGPPFNSAEFSEFLRQWGVQHATSSPYYPQSNGMAERHVQTIKNLLAKAALSGMDPQLVLLEYRTTPLPGLPSPAEMLMGRRLRTPITTHAAALQPRFSVSVTRGRLLARQATMKSSHDRHARLQPFTPIPAGTDVRYFAGPRRWLTARVIGPATAPDSYFIETPTGKTYRRTRKHLRVLPTPMSAQAPLSPLLPVHVSPNLNHASPPYPQQQPGLPLSPPPSPPTPVPHPPPPLEPCVERVVPASPLVPVQPSHSRLSPPVPPLESVQSRATVCISEPTPISSSSPVSGTRLFAPQPKMSVSEFLRIQPHPVPSPIGPLPPPISPTPQPASSITRSGRLSRPPLRFSR